MLTYYATQTQVSMLDKDVSNTGMLTFLKFLYVFGGLYPHSPSKILMAQVLQNKQKVKATYSSCKPVEDD